MIINEARRPLGLAEGVMVGTTLALGYWAYSAVSYKVVGWVVENGWQNESLVLFTAVGIGFGVWAHRRGW